MTHNVESKEHLLNLTNLTDLTGSSLLSRAAKHLHRTVQFCVIIRISAHLQREVAIALLPCGDGLKARRVETWQCRSATSMTMRLKRLRRRRRSATAIRPFIPASSQGNPATQAAEPKAARTSRPSSTRFWTRKSRYARDRRSRKSQRQKHSSAAWSSVLSREINVTCRCCFALPS